MLARGAPAALIAYASILVLGGQNGGFLPDTWGWAGVPLLVLVAILASSLTRLQTAFVLALLALTVWTALSAIWAPTAGPPILEAERALLYVAAVAAVFVAGSRAIAFGVFGASFVLCAWALGDKLFGHSPSRLEGPIGYTNGLGLVAVVGILLALGFARRRPAAAATLLVFAPTLVLTYSRGAWVALGAGLLVIAALALRTRPRALAALGAACVLVVAAALSFGHHGQATGGSARLSSLSGNGRGDYWSAALDEVRAHPALGGGAGTWSRWWLLRRPDANGALDAHELYLETLGELGPIGLLLLVSALAVPLLALRRALRDPLAPALAAAYVAVLVHAALDWDWELPGVMLCGLLCGAALVTAAGGEPQLRVRFPAVAIALAGAAAVFVLQVGNSAQSAASHALDDGRLAAAAHDANRADDWQPWSTQPRLLLGESQLAAGDVKAAAGTFTSLTRRDPGDWELWYQLALASTGATRDDARVRAIALNPHGPAADLPR